MSFKISYNVGGGGGGLSSVGLSMPSAFNVTNSPLIANGVIGVTGIGTTNQYIDGTGALQTFPTNIGGGSAVVYYLNGSVNQGIISGNTYYQMSDTAIFVPNADFSINADGYVAQFITDVNVPQLPFIPNGAWQFQLYFSASSGGGNPQFYIELYKYDGVSFTLISSNSGAPENITGGTSIDLYTTLLPCPQTPLNLTDRIAIRVYVIHSSRTITLHTQDVHICKVTTTFSYGIVSINGLTDNVQYLSTGTSGTDFNITQSGGDTNVFNLPVASSLNTGKLSNTDWSTFNSKQDAIVLTSGSVAFSDGLTLIGNNSNFFWDNAFLRLGIGTNSPTEKLEVNGNLKTTNGGLQVQGTFPGVITGAGLELEYNGTFAYITSYNRTSVSWLPMQIRASNIDLNFQSGTIMSIGAFGLTIYDYDINLGSTTGTKIGTSTTQKLGFYNATPIVKPSAVTTPQGIATALSNLGLLASSTINSITLTTIGSSGVATYTQATNTLNIPDYGSALSGYVPYTGATTNVDLGSNYLVTPTIYGSTSASGNLELRSTTSATKGYVSFPEAGTNGAYIGTTSFGNQTAIWLNTTPSPFDYNLGASAGGQTTLNGTGLRLRIASIDHINIDTSSTEFFTEISNGVPFRDYDFNTSLHINYPSGNSLSSVRFNLKGKQWLAGALALQKEFELTSPTYSFTGASTITAAYNLFVDAPTAGTNATITNNYALGVKGQIGFDWTVAGNPTMKIGDWSSPTPFSTYGWGIVTSNGLFRVPNTLYFGDTNFVIRRATLNGVIEPFNNLTLQSINTANGGQKTYLFGDQTTGNVSIGSTTATERLSVIGNAYVQDGILVGSTTTALTGVGVVFAQNGFRSNAINFLSAIYGYTNNVSIYSKLVTGIVDIGTTAGANPVMTIGATTITISDAKDIVLNTATGTKIGTSTTQKLGFYNATPIVQPSAVTTPQGIATALSNLGLLATSTINSVTLTTTGSTGAATYTQATNTLNIPDYSAAGYITSVWNVTIQSGASYSASNFDYVLINAATQIVTLPAATLNAIVGVKMINATVTSIQIKTASAGVTIDGVDRSGTGLGIFNQYDAYTFVSDGTNWFITA